MAKDGIKNKLEVVLLTVKPLNVELLKINARYMKSATFNRLVENIKKDGCLTSVPLCYKTPEGQLKCISGNHRIKACIEAGIESISVQVILNPISNDEFIAKQLSHNALIGLDNDDILRLLWESIESADAKLYSGLDKEMIEKIEMPKIPPIDISLDYEQVTLLFLGDEKKQIEKVLLEIKQRSIISKENWIESIKNYDEIAAVIQGICDREKIHNYTTAVLLMAQYAENYIKLIDAGEVTQATRSISN